MAVCVQMPWLPLSVFSKMLPIFADRHNHKYGYLFLQWNTMKEGEWRQLKFYLPSILSQHSFVERRTDELSFFSFTFFHELALSFARFLLLFLSLFRCSKFVSKPHHESGSIIKIDYLFRAFEAYLCWVCLDTHSIIHLRWLLLAPFLLSPVLFIINL